MRSLLKDKQANVRMIGMVVGIFVTLIIAILVLYNVIGSIDYTSVDADLQDVLGDDGPNNEAYAENASNDLMSQSDTFFTIAPIIGIVIVAVVILSWVGRIG